VSAAAALGVLVGLALLLRGRPALSRGTPPEAAITVIPAAPERAALDDAAEATAAAAPVPSEARAVVVRATLPSPKLRVPDPSSLPESLARGDILTGIGPIKALIDHCYEEQPGDGAVKFTINASGRVTAASVSGGFAGTPVAQCVVEAARSAIFHASRREATTVTLPFALRAPEE
jgi:hypothetical protein